MPGFLDFLEGLRAPKKQEQCHCAFIPQDILVNVEKAEDTPQDVKLSLRSTIAASKETVKEREEVADKQRNPHEPNLPTSDNSKVRKPKSMKSKDEPRMGCAKVDVYDGLNSDYSVLPGKPLRKYQEPPISDEIANACYDCMNKAQSFFRDVYGWDSIDDKNVDLIATVHHGWNVANAFFFPYNNQMVFGNGNELMYNFVGSYDVVGHELVHGIIQHSSGMLYHDQPGALNEHCADVFGALLEQYVQNQTAEEADWILAQDVLFPDQPQIALRSMKEPGTAYNDPRLGGKDPQPGHMRDYIKTTEDNGGVHWNSGIPNNAFYLAATKKGGYAWETAGKTWFAAMTTATPKETFVQFANRTIKEAKELVDPEFAPIVRQAWVDVGVLSDSTWFGWMWGKK